MKRLLLAVLILAGSALGIKYPEMMFNRAWHGDTIPDSLYITAGTANALNWDTLKLKVGWGLLLSWAAPDTGTLTASFSNLHDSFPAWRDMSDSLAAVSASATDTLAFHHDDTTDIHHALNAKYVRTDSLGSWSGALRLLDKGPSAMDTKLDSLNVEAVLARFTDTLRAAYVAGDGSKLTNLPGVTSDTFLLDYLMLNRGTYAGNGDTVGLDSTVLKLWGTTNWLPVHGKAEDAAHADSSDVTAALQGQDTTALQGVIHDTADVVRGEIDDTVATLGYAPLIGAGTDSLGNYAVVQAARLRGALTGNVTGTADSAGGAARLGGLAGTAYVPKTDSVLLSASSGRVSWDLANGGSGFLTMTSACTLNLPTNLTPGRVVTLTLVQDSTGSRLATWAAGWKFCGDTATTGYATAAPTLTATGYPTFAGDVFTWLCARGCMIFLGFSPAVIP